MHNPSAVRSCQAPAESRDPSMPSTVAAQSSCFVSGTRNSRSVTSLPRRPELKTLAAWVLGTSQLTIERERKHAPRSGWLPSQTTESYNRAGVAGVLLLGQQRSQPARRRADCWCRRGAVRPKSDDNGLARTCSSSRTGISAPSCADALSARQARLSRRSRCPRRHQAAPGPEIRAKREFRRSQRDTCEETDAGFRAMPRCRRSRGRTASMTVRRAIRDRTGSATKSGAC
jgi:ribosomal protein L34E